MTESEPTSQRRYSSDEVADIIRLSLQDEGGNPENNIDYQELLTIGKEMGVSQDQIDRASLLLEDEHQTKEKERLLWLKFRGHCISFVMVNLLCLSINIFTGTETFWAGYVLFGTGLFLLGHYAGLRYAPDFVEMATERTRVHAFGYAPIRPTDDANVSFTVSDPSGLMESEGLIYADDDKIVIEYQTSDSVLGLLKTNVKSVEVNMAEITATTLEHKLWSSELVLQGKNMRVFGSVPGNSAGKLKLKVSKEFHHHAQNLVTQFNKAKSADK
ncbi:MAG: 2TM domain-containing protein [Pseudohongiellaceae bacterium]